MSYDKTKSSETGLFDNDKTLTRDWYRDDDLAHLHATLNEFMPNRVYMIKKNNT